MSFGKFTGLNRSLRMVATSGKLLIVSGPSGVGKGTLLRQVFQRSRLPLVLSVSATTRRPRHGERHGVDYFFLDKEEFQRRRLDGEFLECFEVYAGGDWYGTLRGPMDEQLHAGHWVVLEIDVKGALEVKRLKPEAISIFVEPANHDVLRQRLLGRGSENEESLRQRLEQAENELSQADRYDYRIVNDDLEQAAERFCELLQRLTEQK